MTGAGLNSDLETALAVMDQAQNDPAMALRETAKLLNKPNLDPEAAAVAHWAVGLARRQLNELDAAEASFQDGIGLALENELLTRAAQIRSSLSVVKMYQGDSEGAFQHAQAAASDLSGADSARNEMQMALLLQRQGLLDESLVHYRQALNGLRAANDRLGESRLLTNRGVLHGYRGALDLGVADLETAASIAREINQDIIVAACAHNLGFLEGRRGDVPTALDWFDRAEKAYEAMGRPTGMVEVLDANRAELLLSVGLVGEASAAADASLAGLEGSENVTDLAETRLLAAEVAWAENHYEDAVRIGQVARSEFLEQKREPWAHLASYVTMRAQADSGTGGSSQEASKLAEDLDSAGLGLESQHTRLLAGRLALEEQNKRTARRLLKEASGARRRGPAVGRAQAWYAEALLRDAEGNDYGSGRAIEAGLRVIRDYRASLGTSEMRSHAAAHGLDLANLAVRRAMRSESPWAVLMAIESWRSSSSQVASVRPPSDPEMGHLLAEIRRVDAEIREAGLAGQRTDRLTQEKARLELQVKTTQRRLRVEGSQADSTLLQRDTVLDLLNGRSFVSYFTLEGDLHAVTLTKSRARLHHLGSGGQFSKEAGNMAFALSRLAVGVGSQRSLSSAEASLTAALDSLHRSLFKNLGIDIEPTMVVPSGVLHRLPWPAIHGGAVAAAPSLESGLLAIKSRPRITPRSRVTAIAGPHLAESATEARKVARLYSNGKAITGRNAKTEMAMSALSGSTVAHIAAHGRFRYDNPAFSSLMLSDGPLTVYDLEEIKNPPRIVVLSSCDTGVSKVVAGDELLGLGSALMGMGVSSLVAPIVPISDELAAEVMVPLHRQISKNVPVPQALADAIRLSSDLSPQQRALRASFVALGN